jgi:hypothetical protein
MDMDGHDNENDNENVPDRGSSAGMSSLLIASNVECGMWLWVSLAH